MKHLKVRTVRRFYIDGGGYASANAAYSGAAKRRISKLIADDTKSEDEDPAEVGPDWNERRPLQMAMGRRWPLHKKDSAVRAFSGHIIERAGTHYFCCPQCRKEEIARLAAKLRKEDEQNEILPAR